MGHPANTFYWYDDAGQVLEETGPAGKGGGELDNYIYFGGMRIAKVHVYPGVTYISYYLHDSLGTTRMMFDDQTSTVCYDADYFPWGGEQYLYTNTCPQNYKFTDKERDPVWNGADYFGARWLNWWMGRFFTPDWSAAPTAVPYANFGNPQSLNLYSYVLNNPLTNRDLDGHASCGQAGQMASKECLAQNNTPPPPPTPKPPPMAELKTDMQGHTTTLYTTDKNGKLTTKQIETHNDVVKSAKPGADAPYKSDVVGVSNRHGDSAAYGPKGAFIDTGDSRGRDIHGGGTGLADPLAPQQGWKPTLGCTRGQNEDVINLGNAITQFQQANPGVVIPYVRE